VGSWEPTANLKSCDRLLDSFWKQFENDVDDYPIGARVYAPDEWIGLSTFIIVIIYTHASGCAAQEKEYFAREFAQRDTDSEPKTRKVCINKFHDNERCC
jgi:hypothetical protein